MIFLSNTIITSPERPEISHGALVINNGKIIAVGLASEIIKQYRSHKTFDLGHSIILPGLVNIHTHLELPKMNLKGNRTGYASWVLALLRSKRGIKTEQYRIAAEENIQTLIKTGTTTVADICSQGMSPQVLRKSGMRSVIFFEQISMKPGAKLDLAGLPLEKSFCTGLSRCGISPHTPHTVSEQALKSLHYFARRNKLPLSMHVAETKDELLLLQRKPGGLDRLYAAAGWSRSWAPRAGSSFRYLRRLGVLDGQFLAVHSVQVDRRDLRIIKNSGVGIAHCPRSNDALDVGVMPLKTMLDLGIPVGIGTDSLASVPTLSLWDEMRFALREHKKSGVTAQDILNMATLGGAKALGMEDRIGSLKPGKLADFIAVPLPKRNTGDLYSDLLRETKSCIMTMVNGKIVYRHPSLSRHS